MDVSSASAPICIACGTQYPPGPEPGLCPVCEDERQYVPRAGQAWTTLERLRADHENEWTPLDAGIYSLCTRPSFAIGQRALLVRSDGGNVLWDCVTLLDDSTAHLIDSLGGLACIAISHPHYYTTMVEWAHAFDAPVHVHADDADWIARPDPLVRPWQGERLELHDGFTLIRCGGHFAGGTVLHWPGGAEGVGALLTGDILQVVADCRHVSFMRSYPNLIPLPARAVQHIVDAVRPFPFECVYGAFTDREIGGDGHAAVMRSAERYIAWLGGERDDGRA